LLVAALWQDRMKPLVFHVLLIKRFYPGNTMEIWKGLLFFSKDFYEIFMLIIKYFCNTKVL